MSAFDSQIITALSICIKLVRLICGAMCRLQDALDARACEVGLAPTALVLYNRYSPLALNRCAPAFCVL